MLGAASMPTPGLDMGRAMPGGGTSPSEEGGMPRLPMTGARVCRAGAMVGSTAGGASAVSLDRPNTAFVATASIACEKTINTVNDVFEVLKIMGNM